MGRHVPWGREWLAANLGGVQFPFGPLAGSSNGRAKTRHFCPITGMRLGLHLVRILIPPLSHYLQETGSLDVFRIRNFRYAQ